MIKSCNLNVLTIDGSTGLQIAININFVDGIKTLLNHPSLDINQIGIGGGTALHTAVLKEDIPLIKELLEKGVDTSVRDEDNKKAVEITRSQ